MNKRGLKKQIERKLEQLGELLDEVDEIRNIDSDDPETWDSDTLYNALEVLKEILQLLEDKKALDKKDEFGEPLILEQGICSLVDEYQLEEEISEDE